MKKCCLLIFITALFSCSKSDDSESQPIAFANIPEADVAHDTSNFGIYKGVLVNPPGIVKVNIKNDGTMNAVLFLKGTKHILTASESVDKNQNINNLTFIKGSMKFDFSCNAHGDQIQVTNLVIPDYDKASMILMKEYSDVQVKCFQGTYSGTVENGTFNIMMGGNHVYGLAHSNTDDAVWYIQGNREGISISGTMESGDFSGGIFGEIARGVWQNYKNENGSWTTNRSL